MDTRHSVRNIMRMLERQIVQLGKFVAACPAGHARAILEQQHDQLLKQLAVAQEYCLAMEVGSTLLPTSANHWPPPTDHFSSGW
ncbi:hypothetical protein QU42_19655 [Bradyrhizobium sp. UASWS1016]|jgi:hypothetical protein|nr:hypothetical protein QU42_19655 [Bradyrhizobium sp. UASWS1016]